MSQFSVPGLAPKFIDTTALGGGAGASPLAQPGGGEDPLSGLMQSGHFNSLGALGALGGEELVRPRQTMAGACGALAQYMEKNGMGTMNTGQLRNLAAGNDAAGLGECPSTVRDTAKFLLAGPKAADGSGESARWNAVETRDVAGADGLSGLGNLKGIAAQAQRPRETPAGACGAISQYMTDKGLGTLDTGELRNLAAGNQADGLGQCPPGVQAAAKFLLAGPKAADGSGESARWEAVETHDVAGADGLSGLGNFQAMAAHGRPQAAGQGGGDQDGGILQGLLKALSGLEQAQAELTQSLARQVSERVQGTLSTIAQIGQALGGAEHA